MSPIPSLDSLRFFRAEGHGYLEDLKNQSVFGAIFGPLAIGYRYISYGKVNIRNAVSYGSD